MSVSSIQAAIIQKVPASNFDQEIDWTCTEQQLGNDTIATSSWTVDGPDDLLIAYDGSIGMPATSTIIWLLGGTAGNVYAVTNTIGTVGGRTLIETFLISMVDYITLVPLPNI